MKTIALGRIGAFALLILLLGVIIAVPGAAPVAAAPVSVQINFQDAGTIPPAGYLRDSGESFAQRTGANQGDGLYSYGWVNPQTGQPLDLNGNGRNRNSAGIELRQNTFLHMQADDVPNGINPGNEIEGIWEISTDNGAYDVTVGAGDAGNFYDSVHRVNVEDVLAIDFTPTAASKFRTVTVRVNVSDGRLTLNAFGGSNTKINFVLISPASGPARPSVLATSPGGGATNVAVDVSITANRLNLPNGGLDGATVNASTVFLFPTSQPTNRVASSSVNTTGGGDAITFVPAASLLPNTNYTFQITDQVRDGSGQAMVPYSMTFTTGSVIAPPVTNISFTKVALGLPSRGYTSLTIGPDNRLYAVTNTGQIYNWAINSDGTLSGEQVITALGNRLAIGLAFEPGSTAQNPVLWVSHNANIFPGPHFTGQVSRLTRTNGVWSAQLRIDGLPRSVKDHLTNSLAFGPDGALYLTQGSISAMGAPDNAWGQQPETLLSAAVLRININTLPAGVLNVATGTASADGNLLEDNNYHLNEPGLPYNPRAAGAALTLYATGVRNAFDLVWHSNGSLYVPTNGSAGGANSPGTPGTYATDPACTTRANGQPYNGGAVPAAVNIVSQEDYLYRVVQGGYYGHPNPTRCEWVLNGGNPTSGNDPGQVGSHYAVGVNPDPNWRGIAFNFSFNKSPNGVIEYRNTAAFGGNLAGRLLVVRYSQNDDIIVLQPDAGGNIGSSITGITGFTSFSNPLDLTEHVATGNLYVTEYGSEYSNDDNKITLLRPNFTTTPPPPAGSPNVVLTNPDWATLNAQNIPQMAFVNTWLSFHDIRSPSPNNGGSALLFRDTATLRITNSGNGPLSITQLLLSDTVRWKFVNNENPSAATPLVIGANQSYDLVLVFNESSGARGVRSATLTLTTNDPDTPQSVVTLRGGYMVFDEGMNELLPPEIAQVFGYLINLGYPFSSQYAARGEETLSFDWVRADSTRPVYVRQLAALHGCCTPEAFFRIEGAGGGTLRHDNLYGQSLLPLKQASGTPTLPTDALFNPTSTSFTFNIENYSSAQCRGVTNCVRHAVRFWQVRDPNGVPVPNTYFVIQDYIPVQGCQAGDRNGVCDFNDNIYLVTNIRPAGAQNLPPVVTNPANQTHSENETVSLQIVASDPDAGQTLTYSATGLPAGLSISSTTGLISGTLSYNNAQTTPAATFNVTVNVSDSGTPAQSATASFTWTVNNVNRAPTVTQPQNQTSTVGTPITPLQIAASDPDGNTLSYSAPNLPEGLSINTSTGAISGTPTTAVSSASVTVTVSDNGTPSLSATTTFSWTVNPAPTPNQPPTVTNPGDQTDDENETVSLQILANDPDAGQTLTYSATGLPAGLSISSTTGLISGTLSYNNAQMTPAATYNVMVTARDSATPALTATASFTWTINNVNRAPTVTNPGNQTSTANVAITPLQIAAQDADNNTLTYSTTGLPDGLTINTSTGQISGTPTSAGTSSVTVNVSDNGSPSESASVSFSWTVNAAPANTPPVVTNPGNQTSTANVAITPLQIVASDTAGQTLTYNANGLPDGLSINSETGVISGAPNAAGTTSVTVTVSDNGTPSESASVSFSWTVNAAPPSNTPPVVVNPGNQTSTAGQAITPLQIVASDTTGQTLSYNANGLPDGLSISATTGLISGTPTAAGTSSVTVTVSDNGTPSESASVSFSWTVNAAPPSNTPPVVVNPGNQTSTAGQAITPLQIAASDTAGQTLTYTVSGLPNGLSINSGTGVINGTPTAAGTSSVTVTVRDNASTPASTSVNFSWTVSPPQTTCGGLLQEAESAQLGGNFVVASASNASGGQFVHAPNGTGNLFSIGSVSRATFCFNVTEAGVYRLKGWVNAPSSSDDSFFVSFGGTTNNWTITTGSSFVIDYVGNSGGPDPRQVTLPVGETQVIVYLREDGARLDRLQLELIPNVSPTVANPGSQSGKVGQAITPLQIVASDPDGGTLSYSASGLPAGLSINSSTGVISGTPTTAGTTSVTVTITDNGTPPSSTQVSFMWTIEAVNSAPSVTTPAAQSTVQDSPLTPLQIVASDPDAGQTLTYSASGLPAGLTINNASGLITGTPTTVGSSSVIVTVSDNGSPAQSTQVSFSWTVTPKPNQPPSASNPGDQTSTAGVEIPTLQIAANDPDAGQTLTFSANGLPEGLSINSATGAISGTPTAAGVYSVTITVSDNGTPAQSVQITFSWTVNPVP
ncbi:MAG: putative Ig domain-containing protein [bacterium]|nr:putative Ig domain-containing protein [bacterium]